MPKTHPRICANCMNWDCSGADMDNLTEEYCDCIVESDKTTIGDHKACKKYKGCDPVRVRVEDYW